MEKIKQEAAIRSITRTSDGVVFTIGDNINVLVSHRVKILDKIIGFHINMGILNMNEPFILVDTKLKNNSWCLSDILGVSPEDIELVEEK